MNVISVAATACRQYFRCVLIDLCFGLWHAVRCMKILVRRSVDWYYFTICSVIVRCLLYASTVVCTAYVHFLVLSLACTATLTLSYPSCLLILYLAHIYLLSYENEIKFWHVCLTHPCIDDFCVSLSCLIFCFILLLFADLFDDQSKS